MKKWAARLAWIGFGCLLAFLMLEGQGFSKVEERVGRE